MRKLLKRFFCALLILSLLFSSCALAEGILPVLQTPVPKLTEEVSLHLVLGLEEPEAVRTEDGSMEFRYQDVTMDMYTQFGKALGQEGLTLFNSETDSGGVSVAFVGRDEANLMTIRYHPDFREMTVRYPLRMTAKEADPDNPYTVKSSASSILPPLTTAVSLHSATGVERTTPEKTADGGCVYRYADVVYGCYATFSVKLGKEGYTLVSSAMLEDGTSTAEVTDGNAVLKVSIAYLHRDPVLFEISDVYRAQIERVPVVLLASVVEIGIGPAGVINVQSRQRYLDDGKGAGNSDKNVIIRFERVRRKVDIVLAVSGLVALIESGLDG